MQIPSFQEPSVEDALGGNSSPHPSAVLVVDDEPTIRETLKAYLIRLGVPEVHTAQNGSQALQSLKKRNYDYLFMDLMMPEMGGIEVLENLPKRGRPASVIVMTGYPSMERVIEAMRNGASDFLIKPFRLQDVKLSMERIRRSHELMYRNWTLTQELDQKRRLEELNAQLQREISEKTILYDIIESFSKITRSEELYECLVKKAVESCRARRACFLIYEPDRDALLVFSQHGLNRVKRGDRVALRGLNQASKEIEREFIQKGFDLRMQTPVYADRTLRENHLISIPFDIRKQPFGVLLVSDKKDERGFDKEDEFILGFLLEKAALNAENMALYDSLKESLFATLGSLVSAIEARDRYTQQHSQRVTRLSVRIASLMKCPAEDLRRLESAGPLHDIGKIGIDDHILKKTGDLTEEEFARIKDHPMIGVSIVAPLGLDHQELSIIRNHHERWDGKGYPDGFEGKQIPRLARILAVADAFDAMNSDRAYRKALPFQTCLKELKAKSGTQFDPDVVKGALIALKLQRNS